MFFGAFLGPIFAILMFNFAIFFIVIGIICKHSRRKTAHTKEHTGKTSIRLLLNILGIMFCFGLTWTFGGLTISDGSTAFQFLFVIFNAFQGFYLFLFLVVFSKDAREQWVGVWQRRKALSAERTSRSDTTRKRSQPGTPGRTGQTDSTTISSTGRPTSTGSLRHFSGVSSSLQYHSALRRSSALSEISTSDIIVENVSVAVVHGLETVEEGKSEDVEMQSFTWEMESQCSSVFPEHDRTDSSPRLSIRGSGRRFGAVQSPVHSVGERDEVISNPSIPEQMNIDYAITDSPAAGGNASDSDVVSNQNARMDDIEATS